MEEGISVTVEYKFKPGFIEGFCDFISMALMDTAKFAGFRDLKVVRHASDSDRILLIETWNDAESYDTYIAWRTERGDVGRVDEMVVFARTEIWPHFVARA